MTERIHLVRAKKTDLEVLLPMVEAFHTLFGIKHTEESRRCALEPCLREEGPAAIWLIAQGERVVGYLVLAFGYSLEFGGRDAFVDEVFLWPDYRGKGIGGMALWLLTEEARALGVFAMHLEVRQDDPQAQRLYQRSGFVPRSRYFLMTHRLVPQAAESASQAAESSEITSQRRGLAQMGLCCGAPPHAPQGSAAPLTPCLPKRSLLSKPTTLSLGRVRTRVFCQLRKP